MSDLNDCEDSGYSAIKDGCMNCFIYPPEHPKGIRPKLIKIERYGKLWWVCPVCKTSYGHANE